MSHAEYLVRPWSAQDPRGLTSRFLSEAFHHSSRGKKLARRAAFNMLNHRNPRYRADIAVIIDTITGKVVKEFRRRDLVDGPLTSKSAKTLRRKVSQ